MHETGPSSALATWDHSEFIISPSVDFPKWREETGLGSWQGLAGERSLEAVPLPAHSDLSHETAPPHQKGNNRKEWTSQKQPSLVTHVPGAMFRGLGGPEPKKGSPTPFKLETTVDLLGAEAQRPEALHLRPHSWEVVGLGLEPILPSM